MTRVWSFKSTPATRSPTIASPMVLDLPESPVNSTSESLITSLILSATDLVNNVVDAPVSANATMMADASLDATSTNNFGLLAVVWSAVKSAAPA